MSERVVIIKCEGPACNGGMSADDRTTLNMSSLHQLVENRHRVANDLTTAQLVDRPHVVFKFGHARCKICGYERKW